MPSTLVLGCLLACLALLMRERPWPQPWAIEETEHLPKPSRQRAKCSLTVPAMHRLRNDLASPCKTGPSRVAATYVEAAEKRIWQSTWPLSLVTNGKLRASRFAFLNLFPSSPFMRIVPTCLFLPVAGDKNSQWPDCLFIRETRMNECSRHVFVHSILPDLFLFLVLGEVSQVVSSLLEDGFGLPGLPKEGVN